MERRSFNGGKKKMLKRERPAFLRSVVLGVGVCLRFRGVETSSQNQPKKQGINT